jgi:tetrahydromethanopterin S-methyltransferase subunit G
LVSQDRAKLSKQVGQDRDSGQLINRLDMLDERLDNLDSIVTSLIERVMGRPLVIEVTCPNCGQTVQINVTSGVRVRGKEQP